MPKIKLGINTFEAAKQRISYTFDNFEKFYVAFSGGKDSTVMLHLVMTEAVKRNVKVGVCFIDLEGQFKLTIDHIKKCYDLYKDHIEPFWVCLPIQLMNAVSVYQPHWYPWEDEKEDVWVRPLPECCIHDQNYFPFFFKGIEFEDFVPAFGKWYGNGKKCACFVGIRADESLNRFRTIASTKKQTLDGKLWTSRLDENLYNIYPVYDWKVKDIWIYHAKNPDKPYNRLYDYMYKAGLTLHQMRICQPYGYEQRKGLWMFHIVEPETWARIVARVNGANSGSLYAKEWGNINGYRRIHKPPGHTWESFARMFLDTMPQKMKTHYENKIILFIKWWMEFGGYGEGIPDEAPYELEAKRKVPSWRRVCKSLLRNDYWCKGIGFSQQKSDAYQKYLDLMRRRREMWQLGIFQTDAKQADSTNDN